MLTKRLIKMLSLDTLIFALFENGLCVDTKEEIFREILDRITN